MRPWATGIVTWLVAVTASAGAASQPAALASDANRSASPPPAEAAPDPAALARRAASAASIYTLERCLRLAEKNYAQVLQAKARLKQAQAKHSEARTAPFSEFSSSAGLALAPTLRGSSVYSPNSDVSLSRNMALAWRAGLKGALPLWTFGKITHLVDAAEANVAVNEHDVRKAKNEVRLSVREAYYGLQLARDAIGLVRDASRRIDKYLEKLRVAVEREEGDPIELLKLQMYRAELEARESEAVQQREIARASLAFLIGAQGRVAVTPGPLEPLPHRLSPLSRYLAAARLFRPELGMARAGVAARQAQLKLEQSKYYPDLALALSAEWSRAPEIDDQVNPFVRDSANFLHYGVGLVLRWKLDFLPQSARIDHARAQLEEMEARESFALGGVGLEVEKAFEEAHGAERRLDAYRRATRFAKRWMIAVQQGIEVGTMDNEDIVDPAKEWALKRFAQMTATFDYNMALAQLALATGWDSVAPTH